MPVPHRSSVHVDVTCISLSISVVREPGCRCDDARANIPFQCGFAGGLLNACLPVIYSDEKSKCFARGGRQELDAMIHGAELGHVNVVSASLSPAEHTPLCQDLWRRAVLPRGSL
jgi:hypothetical protein